MIYKSTRLGIWQNDRSLDIVCMQEVRRLGNGSISHLGCDFHWTGQKLQRQHGVGIAIKTSKDIIVNGIIHHSPRLMVADIVVRGCKIRIISAYAPTEDKPLSTKQTFYRELKKLCLVDNKTKLSIHGDFNATTTITRRHSNFFGGRGKNIYDEGDTSNENGNLFLDFCGLMKLSILNTWFDHPLKHRITWHSPDQITKKVIDYSLCESWLRQYITDVRVYNSYFNSDHRLLVTRLKTPANKVARFHKRKIKPSSHLDFHALNVPEIQDNFCNIVKSEIISDFPAAKNTNKMHEKIVTAVIKARESLPKIHKRKITYPWDNTPALKILITQRYQAKNNKSLVKALTKEIKRLVNSLRNKYLAEVASGINEAKQNRAYVEMWRKAKEHDRIIRSKPNPTKCPGLKTHFQSHFNPDQTTIVMPREIADPPDYIKILQTNYIHINNEIPTINEITSAINKLKSNKSSLDIRSETLKVTITVDEYSQFLLDFFQLIWQEKRLPDQWAISRITALWKQKSSPKDPLMYRGISIGSIIVKLLMNIILDRLSNFYESQLLTTQFGFRSGKGCNDGIFVVKQLQEIACRSNKKLYTCFVDLSAAYDHINRQFLFHSIRNRIPSGERVDCIEILNELYNSTKSFMSDDDPITDLFPTSSGVRQGGNESPNLFNLYIDYALRVFRNRCDSENLTHLSIPFLIPNYCTNREQRMRAPARGICIDDEGGYADDIGIHSWSCKEIDRKTNILFEVFREFGLKINIEKTETMIWNWNEAIDGEYPKNIVSINNCSRRHKGAF